MAKDYITDQEKFWAGEFGTEYNPSPVAIPYRGGSDKLFKRDFAGEILDRFSDLRLVDYGFSYHRDNNFPQDDLTWFMLEKLRV